MSKRHRQNPGPMVNLNDLMEVLRRNGLLQNNGSMPQNQQGNTMLPPIQGMQGQQGNLGPLAGLLGGVGGGAGNGAPMPPMSGGMPPIGNGIAPMMPMGISPGKPQQATFPKVSTDDREMLKKLLTEIITILKEDEKKE